jgi:hypothetical protein
MAKRQICVQVDEEVARKMEDIRDKTGIPISRQIELKLKGFKIVEEAFENKTATEILDSAKK